MRHPLALSLAVTLLAGGTLGGVSLASTAQAATSYTVTSTGYGSNNFGFQTTGLPSGGKLKITWKRGGLWQTATTTQWSWWSGATQEGWSDAKAEVLDAAGRVVATSPLLKATTSSITTSPLRVAATPVSSSSVQVTWTDAANPAAGYQVSWTGKDALGNPTWGTTVGGSGRSYQFWNMVPGQAYTFTVKNLSTGVTTSYAYTMPTVQGALSLAVTAVGTSSATATWEASANPAAGWEIGRDGVDAQGTGAWKTTVSGSTSTLTFNHLVPGTPYTITLKNLSTGAVTTQKVTLGSAVAPLTASAKATSANGALLTWSDGGDKSKGFTVGRDGVDTSGTGAWSTTVDGGTTSFEFKQLVAGSTYNLTVKNLATGKSTTVPVQVGAAAPLPTTPPTPTANTLSSKATAVGSADAVLSWTETGDKSKGFYVERDGKDATGYGTWGTTVSGTTTSFQFGQLVGGTTYNLTVKNLATGKVSTSSVKVGTATPPPPPAGAPAPLGASGSWTLAFQDEFNDTTIDPAVWNLERGLDPYLYGHPYNPPLDAHAFDKSRATEGNGFLNLRWDPTPKTVKNNDGSTTTYPYTGGMAHTGKSFSMNQGFVEARIWVDNQPGLWPAFWLLPKPVDQVWPPEIDVMELVTDDTPDGLYHPHFNYHYKGADGSHQQMGWRSYGAAGTNFTNGWHTYGLRWEGNTLQAYLDGVPGPSYTGNNLPKEQMYLLLNTGVKKGAKPAAGVMKVDYVRAWKR